MMVVLKKVFARMQIKCSLKGKCSHPNWNYCILYRSTLIHEWLCVIHSCNDMFVTELINEFMQNNDLIYL